jgi:hypothetical protein
MLRTFTALFLGMLVQSCSCDPLPPEPPPGADAVGTIRVDVTGGTATVTLAELEAPLRALEVDVQVSGGRATAARATGAHDLVEAGLVAGPAHPEGGPRDRFTLVLADTRRLPIADGPCAQLTVDDGATVALRAAAAVDANGRKRPLTVVAR